MKKINTILFAAAALTLGACSDDDSNGSGAASLDPQEAALKAVVTDYVDNTVVPTYRGLADASMRLADICDAMCEAGPAGLTEAQVRSAGEAWIEARRFSALPPTIISTPTSIPGLSTRPPCRPCSPIPPRWRRCTTARAPAST